jgi:cytochrome P450
MEALRFWPGDPVIWRWTNSDSWIGAGSRRCAVPEGTLVMAWNSSAMFDPALVSAPWAFRTDRPSGSYLHWGHGQHRCAGAYLNMAVIPGMLGPLFRLGPLERAPGAAGRPAREGSHGLTFRRFELLVRPLAGTDPAAHGASDQRQG